MRACWLFVLGLAVLNGTDEGPEDWDSRYLRYFRYDLDAYRAAFREQLSGTCWLFSLVPVSAIRVQNCGVEKQNFIECLASH